MFIFLFKKKEPRNGNLMWILPSYCMIKASFSPGDKFSGIRVWLLGCGDLSATSNVSQKYDVAFCLAEEWREKWKGSARPLTI